MATMTETEPATVKLCLRSYDDSGYTYRDVSTQPPRDCTDEEIPVIDLADIDGDLDERKALAGRILRAAETSGFFYIKNHGISENKIQDALEQMQKFFHLPLETKLKIQSNPEISFYGFNGRGTKRVNPGSSIDRKEGFNMHYEPRFDPLHEGKLDTVPQAVLDALPRDSYIWDDVGLPEMQPRLIIYYQSCLALSRRLIRLLALGLDLPEDYFDAVTNYPGGDCTINFYPGHGDKPIADQDEVGLGAHTDLQILTLLWQSAHRGLQVLNSEGEWVFAPPIPGTIVVNIGDFLMRLTNDRLKSTVHRVIQHGKYDRYSMPFFFGFNWNEKCGVVPTCMSEDNPAKYEPATCGELVARRLKAVLISDEA
ncbi:Clavaminate synthase-like protein [Pleurostoma richardsiae]|uniref:Clavaminate synthase-like protein n=1 Tax=Pleurostoma richardsiae TaxID=41990 RepID=A0AA38VJC5_9PEZI|nr:Clavaminate synthase-like protein [Pleurostoma richardsiae]